MKNSPTSLVLVPILFAGCAASKNTGNVVPQPSNITVQEAMGSIAEGLKKLKIDLKDQKTGLITSEVAVTFNITANANDSSKLVLDLNPAKLTDFTKIGGEVSGGTTAGRSNTIVIKFKSLADAPAANHEWIKHLINEDLLDSHLSQ